MASNQLRDRWKAGVGAEISALLSLARDQAAEIAWVSSQRDLSRTAGVRAKYEQRIASLPDPKKTIAEVRHLAKELPLAEEVPNYTDLRGIAISGVFISLDLSAVDLSAAVPPVDCTERDPFLDFRYCNLDESRLQRIKTPVGMSFVTAVATSFKGSNLSRNHFAGCALGGTSFEGCNLRAAIFSDLDVSGCSFVDANLTSAEFSKSICRGSNFSGAKLRRAFFENAIIDRSTQFRGADVAGCYFSDADAENLVAAVSDAVVEQAVAILMAQNPDLGAAVARLGGASLEKGTLDTFLHSISAEERALVETALDLAARNAWHLVRAP